MLAMLTLGMIIVRAKASPEANWLPLYWLLMVVVSIKIRGIWDFKLILGGLFTALLLRFEFISDKFETFLRAVELGFFGYVFYELYKIFVK